MPKIRHISTIPGPDELFKVDPLNDSFGRRKNSTMLFPDFRKKNFNLFLAKTFSKCSKMTLFGAKMQVFESKNQKRHRRVVQNDETNFERSIIENG